MPMMTTLKRVLEAIKAELGGDTELESLGRTFTVDAALDGFPEAALGCRVTYAGMKIQTPRGTMEVRGFAAFQVVL